MHDSLVNIHAFFEQEKENAEALDSDVLEFRKAQLEECEEKFVKPFLAFRAKREEEAASKERADIALHEKVLSKLREEAKREAKREAKEKADARRKIAEAYGATGYFDGISSLVELLTMGGISLEDTKSLLVVISGDDNFEVVSTSPQYIFYMLRGNFDKPIQIAMERNPGEFYGEGTLLQQAYYRVIGVQSFRMVSGAEADLIIFKGVSSGPSKASD